MSRARILDVLAKSDSANPMESDDLIALVGGSAYQTWELLEDMVREHAVMTCHVTRPSGAVVVFWPLGKLVTVRSKVIARAKSQAGAAATHCIKVRSRK
jgi:hypothetical protein